MKKIVVFIIMLIILVPTNIEAKKKSLGNGLYWELRTDGTLVISGYGTMKDYGEINQKELEKRPWHKQRDEIRKIIIENGVSNIGDRAFCECKNLESVEIANSVKSIGYGAFQECGIESITLPNSIEGTLNHSFIFCKNLKSITLSNSLISIGSSTFMSCYSLTSIVIPNSIKEIGIGAFWNCTSLTSIEIPNSVTKIGDIAFNGCKSLKRITISRSVKECGVHAFAKDSDFDGLKEAYYGEILLMPDFMLKGDPTRWGLSKESVEPYWYGIRDDSGKLLIPGKKGWKITKIDNVGKISFYIVNTENLTGLANSNGEWVVPLGKDNYSEYLPTNSDYLIVKKNGYYGVITSKGEEIIPTSRLYTSIDYNSNKTFSFFKKGYSGICNAQGKEISTTRIYPTANEIKSNGGYDSIVEMSNVSKKYWKVSKGGYYGLTDSEGKVIVPIEMEALESAGDGYLKFKVNSFWGLMNYQGKVLIDTDRGYTSIGDYKTFNKRFAYTMNGYKGECDATGRQISKIRVEEPNRALIEPSSSSSSSSSNSSSNNNSDSGNKTTTIVVEHHHDPVPMQEWQQCTNCWGSGKIMCLGACGGTGTYYVGNRLHTCISCNGTGKKICPYCSGQGGIYVTVYK